MKQIEPQVEKKDNNEQETVRKEAEQKQTKSEKTTGTEEKLLNIIELL